MYEFLSSPLFKYFLLPLLTAILTIIIKLSSRPDKYSHLKRDDFAIGINLCVTAMFVNVTKCAIVATNLLNIVDPTRIKRYSDLILTLMMWSIGMLFATFVLAYLMRKNAWEYDSRRQKMVWGIVIPNIVGLIFLVISSAQPIN